MNLRSIFPAILISLILLLSITGCTALGDLLRPSPSLAPRRTLTSGPTSAGSPVFTRTHTPTSTITPSPTATATSFPTDTLTPSPSPTPTIDALGCLPVGKTDYGVVRWVSDGDTVVVEIDGTLYSVRYLGIDAPAYIPAVRYMGPVAKERNIELAEGRIVRLVRDVSERDRFGQLLRYVVLDDGLFVNFQLVLEGLARVESIPPDVACAAVLQQAEQIARINQIGVWKATPTRLPTFTPIPSATRSASPTVTPTGTPSPTLSGSITPSLTTTSTPSLTATSTLQTTLTQSPTPTSTITGTPSQNVQIIYIFYDGNVSQNESDEYVEIKNFGTTLINLEDWLLIADDSGQDYIFPSYDLQPGQSCRVYTNELHLESCGFSFVSSQAIWNNDGDCAYLFDENDEPIDEYCYP